MFLVNFVQWSYRVAFPHSAWWYLLVLVGKYFAVISKSIFCHDVVLVSSFLFPCKKYSYSCSSLRYLEKKKEKNSFATRVVSFFTLKLCQRGCKKLTQPSTIDLHDYNISCNSVFHNRPKSIKIFRTKIIKKQYFGLDLCTCIAISPFPKESFFGKTIFKKWFIRAFFSFGLSLTFSRSHLWIEYRVISICTKR